MKKFLQTLIIIFLLPGALFAAGTQPPGSGTVGTPYSVSSLDHLLWISTNSSSWDKYFDQIADIDASATSGWNAGSGFSPIGDGNSTKFTGSYDGKDFGIDGLMIDRVADYIGLFGATDGAVIKNLGVTNVNITGRNDVGGLVGSNNLSSTITNCYSTGSVTADGFFVGGLVGANSVSTVSNSYSAVSVLGTGTANENTGGLVGQNTQSLVTDSYATGSVNGYKFVGGLVGYNINSSTISNSYSTGSVSGSFDWAGGLAGVNWNSSISNSYTLGDVTRSSGSGTDFGAFIGNNNSTIENCYSTGFVEYTAATDPADKGFVGGDSSGTYSNNFWDSEASNQTSATGATGKTTIEMKINTTFTSAGWDFVGETANGTNDYWTMGTINDGYPYLSWRDPEINLKQSSTNIADDESWDFGTKIPGTDTDIVFTIENTGSGDLDLTTPLTLTGTDAGQFSIQAQPSTPVSASGNTTFTVRFSPTSAGAKTATLSIANNDSDENPFDITLNGTGAEPEINVKQSTTDIPDSGSYNYGSQLGGTNTDIVFTIENTGTANLILTIPLTLSGTDAGQFSIQAQPSTPVSVSDNTTFTVRFSPTSAGAKSATLSIANNDSNETPYDLTLNGTGIVPEINVKQSTTDIPDGGSYDYGSKSPGTNTDVEFTIENIGTAGLTLTTPLTLTGTDAGQFSIQAQPSTPVSASGSTTFTVRFSPTSLGVKTASIAITNSDTDENPYDLTLNGAGVEGTQPPGSGTLGAPYQISILDHLLWVSTQLSSWDKHFEQTADIDATATNTWNSSAGFSPIGTSAANSFRGSYDGQNHTITNLYINRVGADDIGLFGYLYGATVQNLGIISINITGNNRVGGLAGSNDQNSSVNNCYSTGLISGSYLVGGLVGDNNDSTVNNSYSTGSVSGSGGVGGLAGYNQGSSSTVSNTYSTGSVSGSGDYVGGLIGRTIKLNTINNSYSTGSVSGGNNYVGGLVGWTEGIIENCYSTGDVTRLSGTATSFGAFSGYYSYGSLKYSYSTGSVTYDGETDPTDKGFVGELSGFPYFNDNFWDSDASNQTSATCATGKSTTEMKALATFTDLTSVGLTTTPWDFINNPNDDVANNDYWDIDLSGTNNAGYPYFFWQYPTAPEMDLKQETTPIADGGNYNLGSKVTSTTTDIIFTIENNGTANLTLTTPLTIAGANADQFSIQVQPTSPVSASGTTTFTVRFTPTSPGAKTASISMGNNDSNETPYDLTLNGTGTAPEMNLKQGATPIANGGSYGYGSKAVGTNTDVVFMIENTGSDDLNLTTPLSLTGANADQFSIQMQPSSPVSAGGNTTFTVRFSPASSGSKTVEISMANNDSDENPYNLTLTGTGTAPEMDLKQGTTPIADGGSYDYGSKASGTNTDIVFTIENTGSVNLTLTTPLSITGTNADQFTIQAQPSSPVSVGANTTFTVRFSPASSGSKTAAISIANSDSDESPYNLILTGTGTAPEMDLKQGPTPIADGGFHDYGSKATGTNTDIVFTIENTGPVNLTLTTPLTITGTNADQFSIQAQPSSSISAPGSTTFTVRFTPTSSGAKTAAISIVNNDENENPYDLTLNGTGIAPEMDLKQGATPITDGGMYNYASATVGTDTDVEFTIENSGTADLTLTTPLSLTGVNADQFSVQSQPTSPISAGNTTTVTVRFSPTSSGAKTAALSIGNNDGNENPYNLTLNGVAGVPEINVKFAATPVADGGSCDFGDITEGSNTDVIFTIENVGAGSLTLTTPLTITGTNGDQFSILAQPTSPISAAGNTTFTVRFSPTSEGDKTASIAIANNDSDENPYNLVLNGWGAVPEIHLMEATTDIDDGGSHDFGDADSGSNTDVIFTVENFGDGVLTLTTPLTITGANADQFSIQAQPTSSVPAYSNTTFTVRFTPTSGGDKTAIIAIDNNDSDENPYDLIINGFGVGGPVPGDNFPWTMFLPAIISNARP